MNSNSTAFNLAWEEFKRGDHLSDYEALQSAVAVVLSYLGADKDE